MVSGRLVKSLAGFIVGIFVARYLGVERYGVLMYSLGVVGLFSFISSIGMDSILVRELVKDRKNEKLYLATSVVIRLVASFFSVACVVGLLWVTNVDREVWVLTLLCCSTYFVLAGEGLRSFFEARFAGKNIVIAEFMQCLICSSLRIYFIVAHASVFWFAVCCVLEPFLSVVFFVFFYRIRYDRFGGWAFDRNIAWRLIQGGAPLVLSALAITIYAQIDKVMLKNMLGASGNEQVGLYTVALRIMPFVTLVPHMLSKSLFPSIVATKNTTDELMEKRIQLYLDLMLWVGIALSTVLFLLAKPIIAMYGADYAAAVVLLQVVAWKGIFFCTSLSSGSVIIVRDLHKYAVVRNLVGSVVNVAMNYYLIPTYEALGAAVATVVSLFLASFLVHLFMPVYRFVFWKQCSSLVMGPVRLCRETVRIFRKSNIIG